MGGAVLFSVHYGTGGVAASVGFFLAMSPTMPGFGMSLSWVISRQPALS